MKSQSVEHIRRATFGLTDDVEVRQTAEAIEFPPITDSEMFREGASQTLKDASHVFEVMAEQIRSVRIRASVSMILLVPAGIFHFR